jgi:hypothetical protein
VLGVRLSTSGVTIALIRSSSWSASHVNAGVPARGESTRIAIRTRDAHRRTARISGSSSMSGQRYSSHAAASALALNTGVNVRRFHLAILHGRCDGPVGGASAQHLSTDPGALVHRSVLARVVL